MIPVNELRIGNLVNWNKPNWNPCYEKVHKVSRDSDQINDGPNDTYDPVELTPEIFFSCGFEKDNESNFGGFVSPYINDEAIRIRKDEISFYYSSHVASTPRRIQYLHQLQNLFYILTGEELEIKL